MVQDVSAYLTADLASTNWLVMAVWAVLILFRDAVGGGVSPGKRLCGLKVVSDEGQQGISVGQGILRNIPIAIPLVPLVEFFVAYSGRGMKRIGDRIAGTQVVPVDESSAERGSWTLHLIVSLAIVYGSWVASGKITSMFV